MPVVVEDPVGAAGRGGQHVHRGLHGLRQGVVEPVDRLAALEIDVGILRRAPQARAVGRHGAGAEVRYVRLVNDGAEHPVGKHRQLRNLVRRAEAVEEVDERHARPEAGGMRHQGKVVGLLRGVAADQRAAGGAAGHDVLVVAKDRQALRGKRARANVHRQRQQFSRYLVKVRDHQQQPLGGREGRGQGAAQQAPVHRPRSAALGLHLDDPGHLAPQVRPAGRGPLVA